jgi:hypothetical protein
MCGSLRKGAEGCVALGELRRRVSDVRLMGMVYWVVLLVGDGLGGVEVEVARYVVSSQTL